MAHSVAGVNILSMSTSPRPYHHGNLRAALIDAGVQAAREGGPDAVALREVSRRAGVSHNAAYRHFADRDALLRAVCAECMSSLARLMEARIGEIDPADSSVTAARLRLRATGTAYLEFALGEPGWFRTAFAAPAGPGYLDDHEGVGEAGMGPLGLLGAQLDALVSAGGMPPERRPGAELVAWSAVHGLAMLELDGPMRELPEEERAETLEHVLDTIERGI